MLGWRMISVFTIQNKTFNEAYQEEVKMWTEIARENRIFKMGRNNIEVTEFIFLQFQFVIMICTPPMKCIKSL